VDLKTASAIRRLRLVSVPEGISWIVLAACTIIKYTVASGFNAAPVLGPIHGVLFILYVIFWLDAWNRTKWDLKTGALYFAYSIIPGGGFIAERSLRRASEDAVIAERARKEGIVNA
jgi:integral membrane protein